jgi:hypothetical protein
MMDSKPTNDTGTSVDSKPESFFRLSPQIPTMTRPYSTASILLVKPNRRSRFRRRLNELTDRVEDHFELPVVRVGGAIRARESRFGPRTWENSIRVIGREAADVGPGWRNDVLGRPRLDLIPT